MTLNKEAVGSILQCHIDPGDPETFVVGRVLYVNPDSFVLALISPQGRWDGWMCCLQSDLVGIDQDSDYIAVLRRLLQYHQSREADAAILGNGSMDDILDYAYRAHRIIAMELCKSGQRDVIGYVTERYQDSIVIEQFDDIGIADGISQVAQCAITRLYIGDDDLDCIEFLTG